jgi:acyl-CoA thioesterase FadM
VLELYTRGSEAEWLRSFRFALEIYTRMMRPCFYDEELLVHARIVAFGRTSATVEHALSSGETDEIRAVARIAVVCSADDEHATQWTPGQRKKLEAFEGRTYPQ